MHRCQPRYRPLPRLWMMTDERQGTALRAALERLPPHRAGVVFRHHGLTHADRRALFEEVRRIARRRGLLLLLAGPPALARAWRADGHHGWNRGGGLGSISVHSLPEIRAAERSGATLLFLSPIFPTRSHPGGKPLGPLRFALLARQTRLPVIALGGMNRMRAKRIGRTSHHGWAAIDAWT